MNSLTKASLTVALCLPLLAGCVTPGEDDPNASTKQGAVGGALLGLTLGALTGEADLAVQGAMVGGLAGGIAGASNDLQNNRDNIRHDSRNDAIAQTGNAQAASPTSAEQTPQNWQELNHFIGEWSVTIRNHVDSDSNSNSNSDTNIDSLQATGSLNSISQANIDIHNQQGVELSAQFSYTVEHGYQLDVMNEATDATVNFAGEHQPKVNRYNFYPTNIQDIIYQGINSADVHLELAMVSDKLWIIESYAYIDGSEKKLQSIRFNKAN
ncbi:hypothetical protein [uncultured Vibrio sp.]|uniref:hypothetical protein n=1 Tax=uncultured Vibrio sp. TaxID=114054 RepID=UPI00261AF32B|nr:hypothetical protein [uncultured Vibrio sp.]